MEIEREVMDCLNITFEDSLDLEERFENNIHLVRRLIADNEPSQTVVKEVLISAWNKMGVVRVQKAKSNVYAMTMGEWENRSWLDGYWKETLFAQHRPCQLAKMSTSMTAEAHETHRRRKWEGKDVGLYRLLDMEMDIPANLCLATRRDNEQMKSCSIRPATSLEFHESSGTFAGLVPGEQYTRTSHLAGTNRDEECIPTTCLNVGHDHGHMWHPVSYGTQFTNNTLTIAVNGLSLDKDWYDPGVNDEASVSVDDSTQPAHLICGEKRYEADHEECEEIIREAWNLQVSEVPMY
ncbi:hypothetical protein ACFXTO_046815 [Malus domestica]